MKLLFRRLFFVLLNFTCLIFIMRFSINRYDWMLEEDPTMTLPIDNSASMYPWIAITPILLLTLFIVFAKSKKEKIISILTIFMLLCIWAYRFSSLLFAK